MSRHPDRFWRERVALDYVEAHDAGDLEAIAALWEQAEADSELEGLLRELDEGLAEEAGLADLHSAGTAVVLDLARRHLPSGFLPPDQQGLIRAEDVAARLRADPELWRKLDADDRRANEHLMACMAPLPERLGPPRLARWGEGLGVSARIQYWDAFHKVAVRLRMGAGQSQGHRSAARPTGPPPRDEEGRHERDR